MSNKMKRTITMMLVLILSVGILAVPAQAASATPAVEVPVSISLSGTLPVSAERFTIELAAENASDPMPEGASGGIYTTNITGAGAATLSITYSRVGIYRYTIRQIPGTNPDCYQDASIYDMTVFITNAVGGGFDANVAIYLQGDADATKQDSIIFHNRYANPVKVQLSAIKTYNNRTPKTNSFSFKLTDENGALIEKVSNVAKNVTFTPIVYKTEGTFVYKLFEVVDDKPSVIYDKSVYTVSVKVTKDDNGDYQADVSYLKGNKAYKGTPTFANRSLTETPFTGDTFRLTMWVSIMVISLAGAIALCVIWRNKRKK